MKTSSELVTDAKRRIQNLSPAAVAAELAAGQALLIDIREPAELRSPNAFEVVTATVHLVGRSARGSAVNVQPVGAEVLPGPAPKASNRTDANRHTAHLGGDTPSFGILTERFRDVGVLKAVGMEPRQVAAMVLASVVGLGLAAGLIGIPLGLGLVCAGA